MANSIYFRGRQAGRRKSAMHQDWLKKRFKEQNGICAICGGRMMPIGDAPKQHLQATLDHIIPLSKGGIDHWENVQAAHHKCNQAKADMLPEEMVS